MHLLTQHLRASALHQVAHARSFSTTRSLPAAWFNLGNMGNYGSPSHYELPANGIGSNPKDHVTKTWDKKNIQNSYHYDGMETKMNNDMLRKNGRAKEERGGSAITDRDFNHSNKKAMADTPEAPNPVIGMNDERGAMGYTGDPLGNRMIGTGTKDMPPQANEMLMKWRITDETLRTRGRIDE